MRNRVMDDRRVADYFVVAGLDHNQHLPLEEFNNETITKPSFRQDPITDITVINRSLGEKIPKGYECIEVTPTGFPANLNHGSIRCPDMFVCYKRGRDKAPLKDLGILYEGKERLMGGCEVVHTTLQGHPANVNNSSSSRIYLTFRRAEKSASSDTLVVVDVCVILGSKGEEPPLTFLKILKNLNKGMVGSDVFLCYKKAMVKTDVLAYRPSILGRYPAEDYKDFPLPDSVPMFCLPMGATIECWSAEAKHPVPSFSTFIFTGAAGEKVYGAAVSFYEEYKEEDLSDMQMRSLGLKNKSIREQYHILKTVHVRKSISLLSHWPLFDAFKKFLSQLYKISITGPHTVPIERHISHFMYDVPYPSPDRPRILVQLTHDTLSLCMPEDSPLPQSGASFITLLRNLGPELSMNLLLFVLLENKILLHSLRPTVLTEVAEAVTAMIFPFHWQCPYIPLCPLGLSVVLNAPCPFIVGVDSRYFDLYDPPPDVICVDLDTNRISTPEDKKGLNYKFLPKRATRVLHDSLMRLYETASQYHVQPPDSEDMSLEMTHVDLDFRRKKQAMQLELAIQEVFLRFTASILKDYKNFLNPIMKQPTSQTTDASSLFDMQAFLKSRDKINAKFYSQLMKTQMFFRFIEERSFVSDKDASLAFFDECAEKVDDLRDEPKLIEIDTTKASEHTVFIMPPEPVGLPEGEIYRYNGFPVLKSELFLHKQKSSLSAPTKQISCPNSPLARRTKQEVKSAQKIAQLQVGNASSWSKCLQSYVFSLWFVAFPAFVHKHPKKMEALKIGFAVLKKMQEAKLRTTDEVCYRVLMQLAGQYNKPGLAVQVYSQMKKQGLHPNAITYGYYNKVMLEAEWPSPQSKARLRWLKIRNVIIGVAQFRRAVRRRSISLYSNSGSEYDRISHASEDSYLGELQGKDEGERLDVEDGRVLSVVHSSPAAEALNGKNHGSLEERMSTGEASDRGYNSMTQEDVKRMSQIVISTDDTGSASSPATSDNSDKAVKFRTDSWNPLSLFGSSNNNRHRSHGEKIKKEVHIVEEEKQHRESVIRPRVGSIVRKSKASSATIDELELMKGSLLSNSAGLIMVSQVCLERGSCLPDTDLRVEVEKAKRKRHKSAGEKTNKPSRSMSLFAGWRPPPVNIMAPEGSEHQPKVCLRFSELVKHEEDDVSLSSLHSNEEGKVKGLDICNESQTAKTEEGSNATAEILGERMSSNNTPVVMASGSVHPAQAQFTDGDNEKLILEFDPLSGESQTDSVNDACTGSVQPAAARDPNTNSSASTGGASSSLPNILENSDLQENATEGNEENSSSASANLSVPAVSRREMRRSVSVSEDRLSGHFTEIPVKQSLSEIGRTFSSPGANVPVEPKTPEKQVAEDAQSVSSLTDSKKDRPTDFVLKRSQSLKKTNEAIGSFFKYASRAAFSKFNELKQTITTPIKNGSLGSLGSLTQSVEELDANDGSSTSGTIRERLRYGGSQDLLSHSEESVQDEMEKRHSGLSFGSAPSPSYLEGYSNLKDVSSANVGASLEVLGDDMVNLALEVEMSSCSRCTVCNRLIYDEEIMAGWSAEDSNLNTSCPYCHAKFVPHLQIYIKDWRGHRKSILLNSDQSSTSTDRLLTHAMQGDGSLHTSQHSSCSLAPKDALDMTGSPSEISESAENVDQESETLEGLLPSVVDLTLEPTTQDPTHKTEGSPVMSSVKEEAEMAGDFTLTESSSKDFTSRSVCPSEPQVVHYLSPLVLRKEVESLLDHDGDLCLAAEAFVEEHPILFWNLVWYFRRIEVPTHLTGFLLSSMSFSFNKGKEMELFKNMYDTHNILVRPQWDNVRLHEEVGLPMYLAWLAGHSSTVVNALDIEADSFTKPMMTQIIENIKRDDLAASIKLVMNARRRMQSSKRRFRSMYREILYLSFVACGRENIDHDAFDNAYQAAFAENLSPAEKRRLQLDDRPKSERVQLCRKVFSKLEI